MSSFSQVKKIFWATLFLNVLVAAAKLTFAAMTQSLSLFSDGLHSLLDGTSNVVALISLRIAERPPDEDHPYGHRKFETLGALAISALLCLTSWEILGGAWHRIQHPVQLPKVEPWIIGGLCSTIVLNAIITIYERSWGRKLQSPLLLADAEHTLSDLYSSAMSLLALIAAMFQFYWVDTVSAILIVGLILWAAYRILQDSIPTLSDAQRLNPVPIRELVESVQGVRNCHMIRSHGPYGQVQVDLHIVVSPDLTAQHTFEIENEVTRRLKSVYSEISDVNVRHQTNMPAKS